MARYLSRQCTFLLIREWWVRIPQGVEDDQPDKFTQRKRSRKGNNVYGEYDNLDPSHGYITYLLQIWNKI